METPGSWGKQHCLLSQPCLHSVPRATHSRYVGVRDCLLSPQSLPAAHRQVTASTTCCRRAEVLRRGEKYTPYVHTSNFKVFRNVAQWQYGIHTCKQDEWKGNSVTNSLLTVLAPAKKAPLSSASLLCSSSVPAKDFTCLGYTPEHTRENRSEWDVTALTQSSL